MSKALLTAIDRAVAQMDATKEIFKSVRVGKDMVHVNRNGGRLGIIIVPADETKPDQNAA